MPHPSEARWRGGGGAARFGAVARYLLGSAAKQHRLDAPEVGLVGREGAKGEPDAREAALEHPRAPLAGEGRGGGAAARREGERRAEQPRGEQGDARRRPIVQRLH